ncbi:putative L-carnitine dehydratase/bile acid-inducible protein F [Microbacterium sp. C448]|uniref:CaiB/BaiF CoA transferase family protein n=1 Tax=Microbacterium sp. C448 TaxID=1177594 RepID=UPI0003DE0441|nr:CoA transferase [Microbacterium sp. C448]CDJ99061.1 putative L-carnitine dehydratase/bile acid-inducible protein F [Microbacterium sp. C448]
MNTKTQPLAGIRVADFGHVWAGPYCAATLADLGAEVIKVESGVRLDVHRRQGPYPGEPDIDSSGVWNAQNRGKRSVSLNLKTSDGRELARRLVDVSDVAIENYAPGVMARLGLDYDSLAARNPGLIFASLSAFGQTGPQSSGVGYGPSLDGWSGMNSLNSHDDGVPGSLGGIFPDTGSGLYAAAAILAALIDRKRSGRGCFIDLSELEVSALLIGEQVHAEAAGRAAPPDVPYVPVYSSEGRWVFVSGADDIETLRRFASSVEGRRSKEIIRRARAAQFIAAPVDDVEGVLANPWLRAGDYFTVSKDGRTPGLPIYGPVARLSGFTHQTSAEGPRLGEGNDYVLCDILGLSADDLMRLEEQGIVQ